MKLLELRKQQGLNQTEISKIIGTTQSNYGKYELGITEPDIKTLCALADYYNISIDYLCDHKTNQIDISYYSPMAKEIVKKLPQLNAVNLSRLDSVCDGLILGQ